MLCADSAKGNWVSILRGEGSQRIKTDIEGQKVAWFSKRLFEYKNKPVISREGGIMRIRDPTWWKSYNWIMEFYGEFKSKGASGAWSLATTAPDAFGILDGIRMHIISCETISTLFFVTKNQNYLIERRMNPTLNMQHKSDKISDKTNLGFPQKVEKTTK